MREYTQGCETPRSGYAMLLNKMCIKTVINSKILMLLLIMYDVASKVFDVKTLECLNSLKETWVSKKVLLRA